MKKSDKVKLVGRDPSCGRVCFKTGAIRTLKDKLRNRKSKEARNELRKQLSE